MERAKILPYHPRYRVGRFLLQPFVIAQHRRDDRAGERGRAVRFGRFAHLAQRPVAAEAGAGEAHRGKGDNFLSFEVAERLEVGKDDGRGGKGPDGAADEQGVVLRDVGGVGDVKGFAGALYVGVDGEAVERGGEVLFFEALLDELGEGEGPAGL